MRQEDVRFDVCVVGAGFAGLTATHELTAAGRGVVVLEANDRVGGRVFNQEVAGGASVDMGGQWVGPGQDRIAALAQQMGVATFPTYGADARHLTFRGGVEGGADGAAELGAAIGAIEQLVATINVDAPWDSPAAAELDAQTVAGWVNAKVASVAARKMMGVLVEAVHSVEMADISMLHFLVYARAGGSLINLLGTENGAQQDRFDGGSYLVARRLAARLGECVRLSTPVRRITQRGDGVTVEGDAIRVDASRVIVAVPPHMAGRITYDPPMPALRDQLTQRAPMGSVIKVNVVYDHPFWRDAGLSGRVVSDTGPLKIVYDNTPLSGAPGVLVSFFEGQDARRYGAMPHEERRAAALGCLEGYFGARAGMPIDYADKDWGAEPYIRGAYAGVFGPGAWTGFGRALREPVGRIHWAGTETSTVFCGYMDGAVRSGERAAAEVLAAL